MRHLKLYETFAVICKSEDGVRQSSATDNYVEQTLREICLELEDINYVIKINRPGVIAFDERNWDTNTLIIRKESIYNNLSWDTIKEYLLRIKEYLGDNFVNFYYLSKPEWEWACIELNENTYFHKDKILQSVAIEYINEI